MNEKGTILIVIADAGHRKLLEAQVQATGFASVETAAGAEALERIDATTDLVLVDAMMRGVRAIEPSGQLRDASTTHHIPIIGLAALLDPEANEELLGARVRLQERAPRREHVGMPAPLAPTNEAQSSQARPLVLIVEDDPSLRRALARMLSGGFETREAGSCEEFRELFAEADGTAAAVLCDLNLQGESGIDLYRQLERVDPKLAACTIFLTGGATNEADQRFLACHRSKVVRKPINRARLIERLERLVRAHASS